MLAHARNKDRTLLHSNGLEWVCDHEEFLTDHVAPATAQPQDNNVNQRRPRSLREAREAAGKRGASGPLLKRMSRWAGVNQGGLKSRRRMKREDRERERGREVWQEEWTEKETHGENERGENGWKKTEAEQFLHDREQQDWKRPMLDRDQLLSPTCLVDSQIIARNLHGPWTRLCCLSVLKESAICSCRGILLNIIARSKLRFIIERTRDGNVRIIALYHSKIINCYTRNWEKEVVTYAQKTFLE